METGKVVELGHYRRLHAIQAVARRAQNLAQEHGGQNGDTRTADFFLVLGGQNPEILNGLQNFLGDGAIFRLAIVDRTSPFEKSTSLLFSRHTEKDDFTPCAEVQLPEGKDPQIVKIERKRQLLRQLREERKPLKKTSATYFDFIRWLLQSDKLIPVNVTEELAKVYQEELDS